MDISDLGATKLLEALEKLNVSKGAELRSSGPQGQPPAELVRAFEDALNAPADRNASETAARNASGPVQPADGSSGRAAGVPEEAVGRPQEVPAPEWRTADVERVGFRRVEGAETAQSVEMRPDDSIRELARLLERVGGGNASVAELYRLQYLVGMLRVQATGGSQLSQQVNQGFESLLKQQG